MISRAQFDPQPSLYIMYPLKSTWKRIPRIGKPREPTDSTERPRLAQGWFFPQEQGMGPRRR